MSFLSMFIFGVVIIKTMSLLNLYDELSNPIIHFIYRFFDIWVKTSLGLFIFNFLPIYPLDGYFILYNHLPYNRREKMFLVYKYSLVFLLIFSIAFVFILQIPIQTIKDILYSLLGISIL